MTPPPVHTRAELPQFESEHTSTRTPVTKPQMRLVKIDGKLTAIPVQVEAPVQADNSVQTVAHLRALKPTRAVEPVHAAEPVHAEKSSILNYYAGVSLQNLLQQAVEQNASDLHIHSGAFLRIRVEGKFLQATPTTMSSQECEHLIMEILSQSQLNRLEEKHQVDFAYEIKGVGRFRANVYKQQRGYDAVFRVIKPVPPTLADLGLPKEFEKYTEFHQGLMLFTGPAGCGKSSTMAAMADLINKCRTDHILTIEDPIEYVHPSSSCNVTQREVGLQTESFPTALRAALREDPDVIVIGELRDLETISLAITAAETGHLVMATLHTSNAIRTINRLLSVFPPDQICQISRMLSESLKVVISQRLVQRADNQGQVAALEVMINNNAVANLIRENRTFQIKSIMQTGRAQGQRLLDASLTQLMKDKVITKKEAIKHAEEPENFK
jgi:twitching motility protein PilT